MQNRFTKLWPWFFFAAAFQSLLAAAALLRVPSEGLSFARLGMLGMFALAFFSGIGSGLYSRRNLDRFERPVHPLVILSSALLALTFGLLLFLLRYLNPERLLPYYERLSPLLWLFFFLALESALFLTLLKYGFHPRSLTGRNSIYRASLLAFGLLLAVFLFVILTRVGLTPDTAYWGEPGVAIQGWQFILSLLIGFAILLLSFRLQRNTFILPFLIYLTAVALWLSVPLETLASSFYAPISPPTNIPLPYSDAGFYDYTSQSLLIGTGYFGGIPPRPLYVTFLAFLHLLFGQNYPAIIAAQTMVLALFPAALYFLAKKLHSPAAGVTVALFAIFREYTGLWISSNTRVANSKLFTTDFPTALAMVAISLVVIGWLERRDLKSTLVAGGAFGIFLLFRTQSMLTLPVLFVLVLFVLRFKWLEWVKAGLVFALAMVLAVLPWLAHNSTISGKFSFDDPKQVAVIYSQYSLTGNLDLNQFNPETDSVRERIISFTLENPVYVARFITSHFLNTEIGGLLALPLIKPFNGFQSPVNLYWVEWDGSLEWYNGVLVVLYLAFLALGFGSAWRKMGWLGLVPLAFNVGYALSNGISRFSSWRYNLPVDWVVYFYAGLGMVEFVGGLMSLFGAKFEDLFPHSSSHEPKSISIRDLHPRMVLIVAAFALVGASPWLAKGIAQPRYTSTQEELIAKLESHGYARTEIETFLSQPNTFLTEGRLLYPRMYRKGEGLASANPWPAYAVKDFPRIGFTLINDSNTNMIFPTKNLLNFPQGADAIVLVCAEGDVATARIVDFGPTSYQSAPLTDPCH